MGCDIICYADACMNLNVVCEDGANCTINTENAYPNASPIEWDDPISLPDINLVDPSNDEECNNSECCRDYEQCATELSNGLFSNAMGYNFAVNDGSAIICSGDQSCSNSGTTLESVDLYCEGTSSCLNTKFAVRQFECSGQRSCRFAGIFAYESVECSGYESCIDSTIVAQESVLNISFSGKYSGSGAL